MSHEMHVGICGAGIGGLCAAIAIRRAGAQVTVLEAAEELGEVGAGIQITPNASRLLQEWGVDQVIGRNLVRFGQFNLRRREGTIIGRADAARIGEELGHPWWVVHRAHLHEGLVTIARENGADIYTASRVTIVQHEDQPQNMVNVETERGVRYTFNLLIGADGLNSRVRHVLFPEARQQTPTNNCAYRAVVPYDRIINEKPHLLEFFGKQEMETWVGSNGYIIGYPISDGRLLNLVLSHHRQDPVTRVEEVPAEQTLELLDREYWDYDPRVREVISMIEPGSISRWPLVVTGPLNDWCSAERNIALMGDAAHSMVNHMAQGAATSMEDGAFLGVVLTEAVNGRMALADALHIYEAGRMPQARMKQQVSFLNGAIWMLGDAEAANRDAAMRREIDGTGALTRSSNLYNDPTTVLEVYGYDAHAHATRMVSEWHRGGRFDRSEHQGRAVEMDDRTGVESWRADRTMNWFLPAGDWRPIREGMGEVRTGSRTHKL